MSEIVERPRGLRRVWVEALCDCDAITHELRKGQQAELQDDHAEILVKDGKVKIVKERAMVEPSKEKRG